MRTDELTPKTWNWVREERKSVTLCYGLLFLALLAPHPWLRVGCFVAVVAVFVAGYVKWVRHGCPSHYTHHPDGTLKA